MFQLSETEEKGKKNPVTTQSNNRGKAEHREIQMWRRERGKELRKKQGVGDGRVTRELPSKNKKVGFILSSFAPGKHSCQMLQRKK